MPRRDDPKPFTAVGSKVSIRAAEDGADGKPKPRTFTGNAYTGAPMKPEGWWTPIICDLAGIKIPPSQNRPVLRQHDHEQIVGHTNAISTGDPGVEIAGVFSGQKEHTDKVTEPADNGFQWQLSIGANPTRTSFLEAGEEAVVNGRTVTGPMTIAHETELGEVSFVPLGADGDTSATVNASRGHTMYRSMLKSAKAAGNVRAAKFSDDEIEKMDEAKAKAALKECMADGDDDDDAKAKAAKAADDEAKAKAAKAAEDEKAKTEAAQTSRVLATRKAEADEVRRCDAIKATSKKYGVTTVNVDGKDVALVAHAIEHGWTPEKTELESLKAARPTTGPLVYSTSSSELSEAVLECAVFQATRCALFDDDFYKNPYGDRGPLKARETNLIRGELNRRYPEKVQDAAHRIFKSRISLHQLLVTCAREGGYRGDSTITDGNLSEIAAAAMRILADGSSTISVANVTANVLNKFLLQGYYFTERAWPEIAAIRAVKDFKPTKSINLFGDVQFSDLGTSGELKNATLQDQAFANQVKTSGKIITIPRATIINDDLGAFGQIPMLMGRGAGLKLNYEFWKLLLNPGNDNGGSTAFFAATHAITNEFGNSNLSTGSGSALGSAGLTAAVLLFDKQVDPMNYPLGVDAEVLLYPPDLQTTAMQLMNSEYIIMDSLGSTSSSKQVPSSNFWKGRFKPVKSRYLSNPSYAGYSLTAWYLFANPGIIPVIEVAFLNGQEMPTVQAAGPDFQFNIMGMSTRAFFDMGVNMQNFRGAVKSNGA